jgi:endogenous inhibitor of DNA gyrase (YacG/DUF329 family)
MKTIKCPQCSSTAEWSDKNEFRPFCSKRCRLIDLGAWASESHRIKGDPISEFDEGSLETEH